MTQDEIIELARQADASFETAESMFKFAKLVAAEATDEANARANASWTLMCKKMIDAEREACARLSEEWIGPTKDRELHIAAAIRARGEA